MYKSLWRTAGRKDMKKKITNEEIMEKLKEIEKKIDKQPVVVPIQPYIPQTPSQQPYPTPQFYPSIWCGARIGGKNV